MMAHLDREAVRGQQDPEENQALLELVRKEKKVRALQLSRIDSTHVEFSKDVLVYYHFTDKLMIWLCNLKTLELLEKRLKVKTRTVTDHEDNPVLSIAFHRIASHPIQFQPIPCNPVPSIPFLSSPVLQLNLHLWYWTDALIQRDFHFSPLYN